MITSAVAKLSFVLSCSIIVQSSYQTTGPGSGFVTHLLDIGGGLVYIPALNTILGVPFHQLVALSQATMVIGSSVGALTFVILSLIRQNEKAKQKLRRFCV